jgi:nitrogen fixation protein FixH
MNWGTKIVLVFGVFVIGIVYMVITASRQNIDLVVPDYYEKELQFQQQIDAAGRTHALSVPVQCHMVADSLQIIFPAELGSATLQADVWLYNIADQKKDSRKNYASVRGKIMMPVPVYNKGMHEVKITWTIEGKKYYHQQKLFIQ